MISATSRIIMGLAELADSHLTVVQLLQDFANTTSDFPEMGVPDWDPDVL